MAKRDNKTKPTRQSVGAYIKTLSKDEQVDAKKLVTVFKQATGLEPVMWGKIVGFGAYHYRYDSGREGDICAAAFAMRKNAITIYTMYGEAAARTLLKKLGPHKLSGGVCLYIKHLDDISVPVLKQLIREGLRELKKKWPVRRSP